MSWAIIDITNFYVSSERVFDPALREVPVCVLSNNDGCAIARSEEAKALHVKMGAPVFLMREKIKRHGIELRSSNYELYADMNRRFNQVIGEHSDTVEIYSIDETFFRLPVLRNGLGDVAGAHAVRNAVLEQTGLPTRVGLGPTRALSKVANALAKASEKVWGGVIDLHDLELRQRLFREWPVEDVWGIGRQLAKRLHPLGIRTAADLAGMPPVQARNAGTVVMERLVRELNGIECDGFSPAQEKLKNTAVTRMFGEPVTDSAALREAMVRRAVRAAEKIRAQGLVACRLIAFAHGNRFKPGASSHSRSAKLSPASHDPRIIGSIAGKMADAMFQEGEIYTKCGVMLEDLHEAAAAQADLFARTDPRDVNLLSAMDGLNRRYGRAAVTLASAGHGTRHHDTKRSMRSPSWTTKIADVPIAC
ncbi:MAG: Y-family DNA polymerase [Parerythrobacter sp.]